MQQSFCVPWNICMVSMSYTGMCAGLMLIWRLYLTDSYQSDLKPENILLDYTGHIALCDFGSPPLVLIVSLHSL